MHINQIKTIYQANGLRDFKVLKPEDITVVHGRKISEISGYSTLTQDHKALFEEFIINFYNAQGLECRAELFPLSINYVLQEEFLGKHESWEDCYVPVGGRITAIFRDGGKKVISNWMDKKYRNVQHEYTETQNYLRFEYRNRNHRKWQHVLTATQWY